MWRIFSRKSDEQPQPASPSGQVPADAPIEPPAMRRTQHELAEIEYMGEVAVATLTVTELSRDEGAESLADLLDDLLHSGSRHFVLDIQNVQFMDSTCLGCLVEAVNKLASGGGRIALVNADHSVQYLFRLTRLDRVFPICSDVMAALKTVERLAEAG